MEEDNYIANFGVYKGWFLNHLGGVSALRVLQGSKSYTIFYQSTTTVSKQGQPPHFLFYTSDIKHKDPLNRTLSYSALLINQENFHTASKNGTHSRWRWWHRSRRRSRQCSGYLLILQLLVQHTLLPRRNNPYNRQHSDQNPWALFSHFYCRRFWF